MPHWIWSCGERNSSVWFKYLSDITLIPNRSTQDCLSPLGTLAGRALRQLEPCACRPRVVMPVCSAAGYWFLRLPNTSRAMTAGADQILLSPVLILLVGGQRTFGTAEGAGVLVGLGVSLAPTFPQREIRKRRHEAVFEISIAACGTDGSNPAPSIRSEMGGVTLQAFEPDKRKRWLVERGIEIISEASRHLSDELKAEHPEIPWPKGCRHRQRALCACSPRSPRSAALRRRRCGSRWRYLEFIRVS